jgi:hypothetical protein
MVETSILMLFHLYPQSLMAKHQSYIHPLSNHQPIIIIHIHLYKTSPYQLMVNQGHHHWNHQPTGPRRYARRSAGPQQFLGTCHPAFTSEVFRKPKPGLVNVDSLRTVKCSPFLIGKYQLFRLGHVEKNYATVITRG